VDVAVKVVRGGAQAGRELAVLLGVNHPHVVGLRAGVPLADGSIALVLDLVDGGTLAQLVAARGHLRPGEVVTVVTPLARALGDLHALGVEHGDLAPGNVLFDRDGKPMLADLGTVRITGEARDEQFGTPGYVDPVVVAGGRSGPPSDVYGLGALAWFALTGRTPPGPLLRPPLAELVPDVPDALVAVLEDALDPDPARRPAPDALAQRVFDAVPAQPVWLVGCTPADGGLTHRIRQLAADDERPAVPARHRVRQGRGSRLRRGRHPLLFGAMGLTALATGAAVALLPHLGRAGQRPAAATSDSVSVAATGVPPQQARTSGFRYDSPSSNPSSPTSSPTSSPMPTSATADSSMRDVVQGLSTLRARAFAEADPAVLPQALVPGSAADAETRAGVLALRAQGLRYRGLQLRVRSVRVRSRGSGTVAVDVVTDVSAYAVVGAQGRVIRQVAATSGSSRLLLTQTPQGWRVSRIGAG
jgi:serine/threonine protein kinase